LAIIVAIVDKYWGLGGLGIFILAVLLILAIWLSRKNALFPYLLLIIGIAFGLGIQWSSGAISGDSKSDNGVGIPASRWKFAGEIIDNDTKTTEDYIEAQILLKSTQGDNSFTSPVQKVSYKLFTPGLEDGINQLPLQGIKSTIFIQPLNSSFSGELIYCNYTMLYNAKPYMSNTYFVPFGKPTTLVWDFSGRPDIDYESLSEETNSALALAQQSIFQDTGGYVSLIRRYSESWNYQYLALHNYNPAAIENVVLTCGVSATREYRNGNSGDEFYFQGRITFSDAVLYLFDAKRP
jgi:hypothetical protein